MPSELQGGFLLSLCPLNAVGFSARLRRTDIPGLGVIAFTCALRIHRYDPAHRYHPNKLCRLFPPPLVDVYAVWLGTAATRRASADVASDSFSPSTLCSGPWKLFLDSVDPRDMQMDRYLQGH